MMQSRSWSTSWSTYSVQANESQSIWIFFIISCVALYLALLIRSRKKHKLPPGPLGLPIFGYLPFLGPEPYKDLHKLGKKYGSIFGLYLGGKYVVVLNNWEAVKEAYSKNATAYRPPNFFHLVPNGLGFGGTNGIEWSQQRRFVVKAMKDIGLGRTRWEELVQEEVNELGKLIKEQGCGPLDVCRFFSSTFASNMMTLMFGQRLPIGDSVLEFVSECVDSVIGALPSVGTGNFMPWLHNILVDLGLLRSVSMKRLKDYSEFVTNRIKQRIQNESSNDNDAFVDEYFKEMKKHDEKELNSFFTERYLIGNTQVLILGGSETSRTSLIWLLIAMAENQDVQKKVHEELDSVLGKDGKIKWAERSKIPYTYAVIMESMRWKTVVPINTLRMVAEDIKIGTYDVPKGTFILCNIWALHNDPKYWKNHEKFIPERFFVEGQKQLNYKPESYIPFSYGKRSCPGELIALIEILLYFTTLMQKFEVSPKVGDKVTHDTILGLTYQAHNVELCFFHRE